MSLDDKDLHLDLIQLPFENPKVQMLILPVGFESPEAAWQRLQKIHTGHNLQPKMADLLPQLLRQLAQATLPDRTLISLERLIKNSAGHLDWLTELSQSPRMLETLVTLFSGSQFLSEILLRYPDYVERLKPLSQLSEFKITESFIREAQSTSQSADDIPSALNELRRWQRWEFLRIGICDLLGLFDLYSITQQLSSLADSLVSQCLSLMLDQSGISADGFAVIAMGKLGGGELNYSSDIDLVFVAEANPSNYDPLGRRLIDALTKMTDQGFLYRVDMRLRPWGQTGSLIPSFDGYVNYVQQHARLWEKQALLKARVIAGDQAFGKKLLAHLHPIILQPTAIDLKSEVAAMKQRTESHLRQRGQTWGEVKLGEGSIRDVEFIVQYLQLTHAYEDAELLTSNTSTALQLLWDKNILSQEEHRTLSEGYIFLRTIEHYLQMMHHQQTHRLPKDPEKLAQLAKRLGFEQATGNEQFLERYQQHGEAIRQIYLHYLGGDETPSEIALDSEINQHLIQMHTTYKEAFSRERIKHHAHLMQSLDESHPVTVRATSLDDGCWEVTIVGYDHAGELSLICGLFVVYGMDIVRSQVFTYEKDRKKDSNRFHRNRRLKPTTKIVDLFTVKPFQAIEPTLWQNYEQELTKLLQLLQKGKREQAHGQLAKRVAASLAQTKETAIQLYPVDIEMDNDQSKNHTVLHINSTNTFGFLYELTNALALHEIYISRLDAKSVGERAQDMLFVSDGRGQKILSPEKQNELRAAVVLVKHFTHLLPHASNPESALIHFREFLEKFFTSDRWMDELGSLERPEVLDALTRLLGISDFLWDDFLRMQHTNLFPVISDIDNLVWGKNKAQLQQELDEVLQAESGFSRQVDQLNQFKDREMFRIDMRHILGHIGTFEQFSSELTDLAEVIVTAAYQLCYEHLVAHYGTPTLEGSDTPCPLCVVALGKCGGQELGFASDIELMFIYAGNGTTTGPKHISTTEFYEKVVELFVRVIRARREGIFDIDLQLRPYGKAGSMAVSLDAFARYFGSEGAAWPYERQALVRLRPISGDLAFGEKLINLRDRLVYTGKPFDFIAMRAMRERQIRHLVTAGTFNAKFSPGGLVDIEYLVQGLQITHGQQHPSVRVANTQKALLELSNIGVISAEDRDRLYEAHDFLRQVMNALRMVRGNAKDLTVPPETSEEFAFLAKRLDEDQRTEQLKENLNDHMAAVQEISAKFAA